MDRLVLIALQNAIEGTSQREAFDGLLQTLRPNDSNGRMRKCFHILKGDV
jgi:hypothetical protein